MNLAEWADTQHIHPQTAYRCKIFSVTPHTDANAVANVEMYCPSETSSSPSTTITDPAWPQGVNVATGATSVMIVATTVLSF